MRPILLAVGVFVAGVVFSGSAASGQYAEAWNKKKHVGTDDEGVDVVADPSEFSFVTGWVQSSGTKTSIYLRAYDSGGNIKDSVTWGPYNGQQKPHAMVEVPIYENIGGESTHIKTYIFITGEGPRSTLADQDMVTLLWVFDVTNGTFDNATPTVDRYHNVGNDVGMDIAVVGSLVVATGSSAGTSTGLDTVTIAFNLTLGRVWNSPDRYNYNNHDDVAVSVSPGPLDHNSPFNTTVLIAGYSSNGTNNAMLVRQLKDDGSHIQTWRRAAGDAGATAVTASDVAIFVTGWTTLSLGIGDAPDTISEYRNYMTTRYEQGELFPIWSAIYQGPPDLDDIAYSIAYSDYFDEEDQEHQVVYVGGASWQDEDDDYDFKVIRYGAADGNLDWDPDVYPNAGRFDGDDHLADECFDIGVDAQGNPYATGRSIQTHSSVTAFDMATMAFGGADGNQGDTGEFDPLFFDGTSHGDDSASAVEVWFWDNAPFPDTWIAGERTDTSEGLNIGVVKYEHH